MNTCGAMRYTKKQIKAAILSALSELKPLKDLQSPEIPLNPKMWNLITDQGAIRMIMSVSWCKERGHGTAIQAWLKDDIKLFKGVSLSTLLDTNVDDLTMEVYVDVVDEYVREITRNVKETVLWAAAESVSNIDMGYGVSFEMSDNLWSVWVNNKKDRDHTRVLEISKKVPDVDSVVSHVVGSFVKTAILA